MSVLLPLTYSPDSAGYRRKWNGGQADMPNIVWSDPAEIAMSDFGVAAVADGPTDITTNERCEIRNIISHHWRGAGLTVTNDGSIFDCDSHHNYIGARLGSSDSEIRGCRLYDNRDACLFIDGVGGSANCQSNNNHCYGGRIACFNEGSQSFRAVNDTYADSYCGYMGHNIEAGTHQGTFTNVFWQHNMVRDVVFTNTNNHLVNCIVNVCKDSTEINYLDLPGIITRHNHEVVPGDGNKKVGVELADRCTIRGGIIEIANWIHDSLTPSGLPCEGVWVMPLSTGIVIETTFVDWQGIAGCTAIRLKGVTQGCRIDIDVYGFLQTGSKILIVDDSPNCYGLDITIRHHGNTSGKVLADLVDIGTLWTGTTLRYFDTYNGTLTTLAPGVAA